MKYQIGILLLLFMVDTFQTEALAFGPGLRSSTSNITRNIRHQIRQALKPTLHINQEEKQNIRTVSISSQNRYIATLQNKSLILWDLKYSQPFARETLPLDSVKEISISDDGENILLIDSGSELYRLSLADNGLQRTAVKIPGTAKKLSYIHDFLAWAVITEKGSIYLVHQQSAKATPLDLTVFSDACCVQQLDNKSLLSATNKTMEWISLQGEKKALGTWKFDSVIKEIVSSDTEKAVAILHENEINLIDLRSGKIKWKTRTYSNEEILIGFSGNSLYAFADGKLIQYSLSTGKPKSFNISEDISFSAREAVILNNEFALLLGKDGLGYGVSLSTNKLLIRLIITNEGWTVVDERGRFDGTANGVREIAWAAGKRKINIAGFADKYYEPGLLSQITHRSKENFITKAEKRIEDGIYLPPKVNISIKPLDSKLINLDVSAKAHTREDFNDIKEVYLYRNGKRIPGEKLTKKSATPDMATVTWSFTLGLDSEHNQFQAFVSGWENIKAMSEKISYASPSAKKDRPAMIITSIGINRYASEDLTLNYAVADATAVAENFSAKQISSTERKVKTLILDNAAKGASLRAQLKKLSEFDENDTIILFLSGHGVALNKQWYFLPQESRNLEDPEHIKNVGLTGNELAEALIRAPSQKIFLAVDACQSGAILGSFDTFLQRKALQQVSEDAGIHVVTATRADQLAPEFDALEHGLFTYTMLKGLATTDKGVFNADKWPADGNLTIGELKQYVMKYSPILARILTRKHNQQLKQKGLNTIDVLVSPAQLTSGKNFSLNSK